MALRFGSRGRGYLRAEPQISLRCLGDGTLTMEMHILTGAFASSLTTMFSLHVLESFKTVFNNSHMLFTQAINLAITFC